VKSGKGVRVGLDYKMPLGAETMTASTVNVLSVSPNREDHASLQRHLGHSRWSLFKAQSISTACALIQQHDISVVVCESELMPETWIDMLHETKSIPNPPSLIVASRLADDRLWAEALNLGAWDVLAKPFDRTEVLRSVRYAWEHYWHRQPKVAATPMKTMRAAS
jgi:DNA-binding NtrC family response regulator